MTIKLSNLLLVGLSFFAISSQVNASNRYNYPFYVGMTGGYGSTTWAGLVPRKEKQGPAINLSTPILVKEGGGVWGIFAGVEPIPYFALEVSYLHFPSATIHFDDMSLFAFNHDWKTELVTHTEAISGMAKLMIFIPHTDVRIYSGVGAAAVHRKDLIIDTWRLNPMFGAGVNYNVTSHVIGEIGATYIAGYGESELNPAEDFVPFLYTVFLRLAYRF